MESSAGTREENSATCQTSLSEKLPPDSPHLISSPSQVSPSSSAHLSTRSKEALSSFPFDLVLGGLLGGVAHSVVAPIERVKLVLQTQDSNLRITGGYQRRYRGMLDAFISLAKEEGFWSLWRGNGTSVLRYYPSLALNFAFKDYYRAFLGVNSPFASTWRISAGNFSAGAAAGATSLLFTYPLDIAHTRLATDIGTKRQFTGIRSFISTIYRREGLRGLYRGFHASVQGIIVHRSVYFGGFDTAKQLFLEDEKNSVFWKRWLLAQGSTTSAGLIAYPFDTVRHRMMMQSGSKESMYASTWDCWKMIYRKEGIASFYKGCLSNMFRGTGAALVLVLYDELKWFFRPKVS